MSLRSQGFASVYDTSTNDVVREFFVPALRTSIQYDRGVGYFSSGFFRNVAQGLVEFAAHEGQIRLIASPILDEADWEALSIGEQARWDIALRKILQRDINSLAESLAADTLSALAWMVADDILTFKVAVPVNKLSGGEFHTKFGIFTDAEGNRVSFEGSNNETVRGTVSNFEKFKVFCSWEPVLAKLVDADIDVFERLWTNGDPNVQTLDLPEAARNQLLSLRTMDRPYPEPSWVKVARTAVEGRASYSIKLPQLPENVQLRDYQLTGIDAWIDNDYRGLFEMATGTGKTITALAAMVRLYVNEGRLAIIIAVPYQHLVDQWEVDAKRFGLQPILAYEKKSSWLPTLTQHVQEYNRGDRSELSVIVTHATFTNEDFQRVIGLLVYPTLLIADEVHHLGAEQRRTKLPANINCRLALSATPDRWHDESGTQKLREYFGDTVFRFSLERAIQRGILTPYSYFPQIVELSEDEMQEYRQLSVRIARLINAKDEQKQEALDMLLIKRAKLLNNAGEKLPALEILVRSLGDLHHALFYCAPEQIDQVSQLLGWNLGLRIGRFTAKEPNDLRQQILSDFDAKILQGLVAMKCLDEGVDVPSTRVAFVLASSGNPREFIQRRGRILRRATGKSEAHIYDFIAVPSQSWSDDSSSSSEKSIIEHELHRFREFANSARNKHEALEVIWGIASRYGLHL